VRRPVLAATELIANLVAVVLGGLWTVINFGNLLAQYGEHSYSCVAKPLPCLAYSKVDDPFAVLELSLVLGILTLLLIFTVLHIRTRGRQWFLLMLGTTGSYWLLLIIGLGILIAGYVLSALAALIGGAAALADHLAKGVDSLESAG
jgi:hypothetical protein